MINRDYCMLSHPGVMIAASFGTRAMCEQWRDRLPAAAGCEAVIDEVPTCTCCGDYALTFNRGLWGRCAKHQGRNPCAIEGCRRTAAAPASGAMADDAWLCADHWRRYVPPRSQRRRAYHAFFRRAKREGWTDELQGRFWRFWRTLIHQARRQASEGHLDEATIRAMFGWEEAA